MNRFRPLAAVVGASALLAACVGADDNISAGITDKPYYADTLAAASNADSDFEREALGDGELTKMEYEEAITRFVDCMANNNIDIAIEDQGGYYAYTVNGDGADFESKQDECGRGTKSIIEPLYVSSVKNPTNGDMFQVRRDCFVRHGLVDDRYTANDLENDMNDGSTIPYIVDPQSPEIGACFANPTQ